MPILETQGLTKIFGGLTAVSEVSFAVPERTIASIIGPNGAGKTTFFNMLTGLYKPSLGRVEFRGKDITARRPDRITNLGVARTFQNIRLFGTMTAVENVLVGRHGQLHAGVFGSVFRTPRPAGRSARAASAPASCSSSSASSPRCSTRRPPTSPTATSGASRSPGHSPQSPASCSWTSRRRA